LKQNLNPHFLGNALSNLQGLLLTNQAEKAEKYLEDFGQVLKISLANADAEFIALHEEMEFLQFYFSLENERLGNAIQLNLHGLERVKLKELQVPHLITQPLVENAFKHGFNRTGKGVLRVEVDMESSDCLRLTLLSDAVGIGNVSGWSGGMGLGLLRQRLDALFGENPGGWIQWTRLDSGQFQVQLMIPQGE
jgi:LytS/YehU family sensor histidine kinase